MKGRESVKEYILLNTNFEQEIVPPPSKNLLGFSYTNRCLCMGIRSSSDSIHKTILLGSFFKIKFSGVCLGVNCKRFKEPGKQLFMQHLDLQSTRVCSHRFPLHLIILTIPWMPYYIPLLEFRIEEESYHPEHPVRFGVLGS